uniref:Kielin/chordin-like protein n=1 Tax=Crassostrea virginica TaxID=6565 RepID=A0A8B8CAE0_CRAVI|nr:kielin/chordin-like protein [Crassostrea virginica]
MLKYSPTMKEFALIVFACYVGGQIIMPTAEPGPEPITQTPGKPGTCPVYDIIANCKCRPGLITCDRDGQCPASQKCCSYGCGCRPRCVDPSEQTSGTNQECLYNGVWYMAGESFRSVGPGCNTCFCEYNGRVFCTKMWCYNVS